MRFSTFSRPGNSASVRGLLRNQFKSTFSYENICKLNKWDWLSWSPCKLSCNTSINLLLVSWSSLTIARSIASMTFWSSVERFHIVFSLMFSHGFCTMVRCMQMTMSFASSSSFPNAAASKSTTFSCSLYSGKWIKNRQSHLWVLLTHLQSYSTHLLKC